MITAPPRTDTAAAIKSALTMRRVAEGYGFTINRSGFIHCPFHQGDNTGSLKIYPENRGFCCFGCGASGSVIDFTMRLFDIPFKEAIKKLNSDFSLGLSLDRPNRAELSRLMRQRQAEARRREEIERRRMELFDRECMITAEMNRCEMTMEDNPPTRDGWNTHYPPEWVEAVKRRERLEMELYLNDCEEMKFEREQSIQSRLSVRNAANGGRRV